MIRDYALATSGLLSPKMYGPGVKPYQPENLWEVVGMPGGNTRQYVQDQGENLYRRSIYSFWKRMAPPANLEGLNAPSREVCSVRRERTNTPLQALITLNDTQFFEAARVLAQNALSQTDKSQTDKTTTETTEQTNDQQKLQWMSVRVLSRELSEQESGILLTDYREYLSYYQANPEDAQKVISIGETKLAPELSPQQVAAWTLVANQILNLDEALNK